MAHQGQSINKHLKIIYDPCPIETGMVLGIVLIFAGLIAAMVIYIQISARLASTYAERKNINAQLRASATEATFCGLNKLASDNNYYLDHTNEPWAQRLTNSLPNGITTRVVIIDENRFFDINNLSIHSSVEEGLPASEVLKKLLMYENIESPALKTDSVHEWFLQTNAGRLLPSGSSLPSEHTERLIQSPYQALTLLDLSDAPGTTTNWLTVLPFSRRHIVPLNLNTATPSVFKALFGAHEFGLIERICKTRQTKIISSLKIVVDEVGVKRFAKYKPYLDVKSSFFSVKAIATKGNNQGKVYCLAHRTIDGKVDILRWIQK